MGVDVYLSWDGMTQDDRSSRNKWLSLNNGNAGYLRAPWWMKREVLLLFTVFEGCHIDESPEPVPYDFEAKLPELERAAGEYRRSVEKDERSAGGKVKVREMIENAPKVAGFVDYPFEGLVMEESEDWLKNVFDFFRLGRQKQEEREESKSSRPLKDYTIASALGDDVPKEMRFVSHRCRPTTLPSKTIR